MNEKAANQLREVDLERSQRAQKRQERTTAAVPPGASDKPPEGLPMQTGQAFAPGPGGTMTPVAGGSSPYFNPQALQPEELALLRQVPGWKEGDPVPTGLADVIAEEREKSQRPPEQLPKFRLPAEQETVDIASLSPERQRELAELVAQAKQQQAADEAAGPAGIADLLPEHEVRHLELDIEDDRPQAATTAEAPGDNASAAMRPTHCPHCNWDLSIADDPDPSDDDRMDYVQAILGGQQFLKTYYLFDSQVSVTFRELSQAELDTVFDAATKSSGASAEVPVSPLEVMEQVMRFRLCLQMKALRFSSGRADEMKPSLEAWAKTPESLADRTQLLSAVREYVYAHVIKNESLSRMLHSELRKFNQLVSKLEVAANRKNFWTATP